MLEALHAAICVKGRKNAAIARELDVTPHTVTGWLSGRNPIPARKRNALETAIGAPVDWPAYDAQFAAHQASRPARPDPAPAPPSPAPMPAAPAIAAPALAPMPRSAPQRPATAPRRLTATPPPQKPERPSGAAPAPAARKGGILGFLFDPSDDGMNFA